MNVYPFIDAEKKCSSLDGRRGGNVKRACELLKVSRSAYYAGAATQQAARPGPVRTPSSPPRSSSSTTAPAGRTGPPRIHTDLVEAGHRIARKRAAQLMRESGAYGKTRRKWVTTTVVDPDAPGRPDLIKRDFHTDATGLDLRWC